MMIKEYLSLLLLIIYELKLAGLKLLQRVRNEIIKVYAALSFIFYDPTQTYWVVIAWKL